MDKEVDKELHKAIASKNTQTVRQLIHNSNQQIYDDKYIVDQLLKQKWSLCNVVHLSKPNITKLLLESDDSINVNEYDEDEDGTALHEAAYALDVDHVKLLLEHKADPNSLDGEFRTALHYPYEVVTGDCLNYKKRFRIFGMLIEEGAKPMIIRNNINYFQIEPLLIYGNREEVECALKLLHHEDIDLRVSNDGGDTVLHFLARNEHPEIVSMIRGRDFNVNARNDFDETPLWGAVDRCYLHSIEFLLSQGADVNIANYMSTTPLWLATQNCKYYNNAEQYTKCITLLLENGADVQFASTNNYQPATVFDLAIVDDNENCYLYRLMTEHLALQEVNGAKITELIQSKIDLSSSSKKYYNHCKMLLAKKVYESETTLTLLSCSEEKLAGYMRNEEMVQIINYYCKVLKLNSVAYGDLLQKRFEKAKATAQLRGEAGLVIAKLINVDYDCYFSIVDMIVRFLNERDLNTLLNV